MAPHHRGAAAFALRCKSGRSFFCCQIEYRRRSPLFSVQLTHPKKSEQRHIMALVAKGWLPYIAKYP